MAAPIRVRSDLSSDQVRAFSRSCRDAGQVRRLLAIATILDGGSRSEAARIAGVTLQIIRDWVLRFNEDGIAGLHGTLRLRQASVVNGWLPHMVNETLLSRTEVAAFGRAGC